MGTQMTDGTLKFRKSSYSNSEAECVEVADLPGGGMAVRDSKDPEGGTLKFNGQAWQSFVNFAKTFEV